MRTQNRNRVKFISMALVLMMMTSSVLTAQEAGGASLPADSVAVKKEKKERDYCRHEFSVWTSGGVSTFNLEPNFGERDYRFGGNAGIGYSFYFGKRWAVMAGAEMSMYNTKLSLEDYTDRISTTDPLGNPITYIVDFDAYTEKDRLYTVNLPLQVQFQTIGKHNKHGHKFFASLGGKAGYALKMEYKHDGVRFNASGDYLEYGQILYDQRDLGYGDYNVEIKKQDIKMDWSWMATAETGVKWNFKNPRYSLYTGVYFEWGFNEIRKEDSESHIMEYDPKHPDRMSSASLLSSRYDYNGETIEFTDKVSTLAFGAKVRLGINLCANDYTKIKSAKNRNKSLNDELETYKEGYRDAYNDWSNSSPELEESMKNIEDMMKKMMDNQSGGKIKVVSGDPNQVISVNDDTIYVNMNGTSGKRAGLNDQDYKLMTDHIYFERNSSEIRSSEHATLDAKVRIMQSNPQLKIRILGNTCDLAGNSINLPLGLQRAESARQYLVGKGIEENRISTATQASEAPIVPNTSEANRKLNRRGDFELIY